MIPQIIHYGLAGEAFKDRKKVVLVVLEIIRENTFAQWSLTKNGDLKNIISRD